MSEHDVVERRRASARCIELWYTARNPVLQLRTMQREFRATGVLCAGALLHRRKCVRHPELQLLDMWSRIAFTKLNVWSTALIVYRFSATIDRVEFERIRERLSFGDELTRQVVLRELLLNVNIPLDALVDSFDIDDAGDWHYIARSRNLSMREIRRYNNSLQASDLRANPYYRPVWLAAIFDSGAIDLRHRVRTAVATYRRPEPMYIYPVYCSRTKLATRIFPNYVDVEPFGCLAQSARDALARYRAAYIQRRWRMRRARRVERLLRNMYDELVAGVIASYICTS